MAYQSCYVLVGSELTSVTYSSAAKRTLLFALPVVRLNAVGAESMQARFINNWVARQLLADGTCQVFHHPFNKFFPDAIV